ncbi:hypothetical protein PNIG_a0807 [Pseudoalteromonas nigrifaciens]|uniref:Uncharacterized protein n=1 Tax=Pseudoalteromonas nigrifaciens TaxID=28109 RepID=A0AAC9UG91_9GAMM|nr:hypothetical protein PNIG_a0807 [Pseudoalteromonas nigrifaciens]
MPDSLLSCKESSIALSEVVSYSGIKKPATYAGFSIAYFI